MGRYAGELGRIGAIDGSGLIVTLEADTLALGILNQLSAPLYISWSTAPSNPPVPTAAAWDSIAPGSGWSVIPIPTDVQRARLRVIYPGGVPAADLWAIVYGLTCTFAPSTSPLE